MQRRLNVFVLVMVLPFFTAWAQEEADSSKYFPLALGNAWTYFTPLDLPNAPPDTLWDRTSVVHQTLSLNDTLYYLTDYPFALADTLREDEQSRIWARLHGRDVLLFDFTLTEGDSYPFPRLLWPEDTLQVTIQRELTVEVAAGRFENCIRLSFDSSALDDGASFVFAQGVGIVYAYGDGGWYEELYSAEINGHIITTNEAEASPSLESLQAFAYPNPFTTSTAIVVPLPGFARPQVSVYDVLGRRVAMLGEGECDRHRCMFEWDGARFPSGAYYVKLEQGSQVTTIKLILSR